MNPKLLSSWVIALFSLLITSSAFSQNAYITNRNDNTISVINTQTNKVVATIPVSHDHPSGVIVSHDGLRAYVSYYTDNANAVTVINTVTNKVIGDIVLNTGATFGGILDISPDGNTIYAGCKDSVVVIDANTLTIKRRILTESGNSIQGIAISPDGLHVYVNGFNKIIDISTQTNAVTSSIAASGGNFLQLAINYQNTKLYAADKLNGNLNIFDLQTRTNKSISLSNTATNCVCVSPDGTRVYATNYHDNTVCVVDGNADTLIKKIKLPDNSLPYGIAITPDGKKVYAVCFVTGKIAVINTSTNEVMTYIKVGFNPVAIGRFIGSNGVLPVKLTRFTASEAGNNVQLKWQTANEVNTSFYTVERSTDGIHFTAIGSVAAIGSNAHAYQYNDGTATGLQNVKAIYYRLIISDKNGASTTSNIVVFAAKPNITALLLLPNPVQNLVKVTVNNFSGKATFTVVDMSGKQWQQQRVSATNGATVSINTSALPAGTYILRFIGDNAIFSEKKFIKL